MSLSPSLGVGIDFSYEMIKRASKRYPKLCFLHADVHNFRLKKKFDVIILSDLVNDLWDVQAVLENLLPMVNPHTRLIINTYSRVWEIPIRIARNIGVIKPNLEQNWLTVDDIKNLLKLTNFETIKNSQEILLPINIPLISSAANRFIVKFWPFSLAALTNFIIARPQLTTHGNQRERIPSVSVIIPARNEAGNISSVFERVPEMGAGTQLIFVEGHSTDQTYEVIMKAIDKHPNRCCKLLKQTGKGKGDAVRQGFANSNGNILMILDADLTVPPEDLPRFLGVLVDGKAEFVNGVRLVYPMEHQAMRYLNMTGNKIFSLVFSWLLGQPIKDTLCGTKALWSLSLIHI